MDALTSEPLLRAYTLLPSVRGDLVATLGRYGEARQELERAAPRSLTAPGELAEGRYVDADELTAAERSHS